MLTAIPEGPVTIDQATQEEQAKTGYVISVNGKQGAVAGLAPLKSPAFTGTPTINGSPIGESGPPSGTPDHAVETSLGDVSTWRARGDFIGDLAATPGGFTRANTPEQYGAARDGTTADDDALSAALDAGQLVQFAEGRYGLSGRLTVTDGKGLRGRGNIAKDYTADTATTIVCLSAGAGIDFTGGGYTGVGVTIDAGGLATSPVTFGGDTSDLTGANPYFRNFNVINAAGDNLVVNGTQNGSMYDCQLSAAGGHDLVLDYGCGGWQFTRCEFNSAVTGHALLTRATGTIAGLYAVPTHITFTACIFEYGQADVSHVRLEAGTSLKFEHCAFGAGTASSPAAPVFEMVGNVVAELASPLFYAVAGQYPVAVKGVGAGTHPVLVLSGLSELAGGAAALLDVDANGLVLRCGQEYLLPIPATVLTSAATPATAVVDSLRTRVHIGAAGTNYAATQYVAGEAQPRFRRWVNGTQEWGPGSTTAPDISVTRTTGGGGLPQLAVSGDWSAKRHLRPYAQQILGADAAVTVDTSASDVHHILTVGHAVTGLTVSNALAGQDLRVLILNSGGSASALTLPGSAGGWLWAGGGDAAVPVSVEAGGVLLLTMLPISGSPLGWFVSASSTAVDVRAFAAYVDSLFA